MTGAAIMTGFATFKQTEGKLYTWDCLVDESKCNELEMQRIVYMRLVAAFTCLSFIFELICIAYDVMTFWTCCLKEYIIHPLSCLAFLTFSFLMTVVIIYAVAHNHGFGYQTDEEDYGYTYWLIVASSVLAAIDMVVASITIFFAETTVMSFSLATKILKFS
ncbi:hypothetical protein ANCCAN_01483 [Ancylostoma caninum]|uniref:MARVEL domain-containing protein n=1 Tax=Ancylostoma caninum TaxID=29170 RepID=A0A368HAQ0_ANCCA|nr:hypothetical protein ANCCAN_01483 [Ancylostoma caninum]